MAPWPIMAISVSRLIAMIGVVPETTQA